MIFHFDPLDYMVLIILAIVLLATGITHGQEKEQLIFQQINQLRGPGHQLTYDSAKQKQVDWYASTNGFKKFIHSGLNCGEILAASSTGDDFVTVWLRSKPHTKNMKYKPWKSMACRVVKIKDDYYQAVVQFFY